MTSIHIKLTTEEAELLSSLASDQLFRREFIDPKMPGHRANPGALRLGKQLVERLQSMADQAKGARPPRRNAPNVKTAAAGPSAETQNPLDIQLT
jgi:hypothetical protein